MPGTRVLDAHVYIGCHHLLALKVRHQLTLAGIERATFGADPKNLDLPCSYPGAAEVADRWRHPRYLTRRGNFHSQKYPHPRLAPIPAPPRHQGCVSKISQLPPCDNLDLDDHVQLLTDDDESNSGLSPAHPFQLSIVRAAGAHSCVLTCSRSLRTFPNTISEPVKTRNVKCCCSC